VLADLPRAGSAEAAAARDGCSVELSAGDRLALAVLPDDSRVPAAGDSPLADSVAVAPVADDWSAAGSQAADSLADWMPDSQVQPLVECPAGLLQASRVSPEALALLEAALLPSWADASSASAGERSVVRDARPGLADVL